MKYIYSVIIFLLFCHLSYAQLSCPGLDSIIYSGQTYHTVAIGSQCWLKENLNVGTMIDSLQNQTNNSVIEKYCYGNNPENCAIYGGLYQWNEAMQYTTTSGTKGICPIGWHIPNLVEFQTLSTTVNKNGNSLKAFGQGTGTGTGTNTSGFSALMSGVRNSIGNFSYLGNTTYFWSSTEYNTTSAGKVGLGSYDSSIAFGNDGKEYGWSVRCLKDGATGIKDHSDKALPKSFDLFQNFPNPFNPSTVISYSLTMATNMRLSVYNSLGQTMHILENGFKNAGTYTVTFNASELTSGTYFYRLEAGQFSKVMKMMLVK